MITTIAGTGQAGYRGDGGPAADARLEGPIGLVFDTAGNLFIVDGGDGGQGRKAKMSDAAAIAVDKATGDIYIADHHNDRIRRVDRNGLIATVVGTGAQVFSGDGGPAQRASIDQPYGLTVARGYLYFTDTFDSRVRIVRLR